MKILICGDFTTSGRGMRAVTEGNAISKPVRGLISEHDLTIVNLEAPVVMGSPPKIKKYGPCLKTEPATITYLKKCGIGYVTLANNHYYDYGEAGVVATIDSLNEAGINYVGGGEKEEDICKPLYIGNNKEVCVLNYCESESSVGHKMGSNALDSIKAHYDIQEAKRKGSFVVVIIHGGHEGYQLPSPRMKRLYRFLIDSGANVVVNHHQHCYSGYESYNEGVIFYGLGNFFFDKDPKSVKQNWFEGYMVSLDIEGGKLVHYQLFPYYQCKSDQIEVRLMCEAEKELFFQQIRKINETIADDSQLEQNFGKLAGIMEKEYIGRFTPYGTGKLLGAYRRGLVPSFLGSSKRIRIKNAISCEAHRDVCLYLLRNY